MKGAALLQASAAPGGQGVVADHGARAALAACAAAAAASGNPCTEQHQQQQPPGQRSTIRADAGARHNAQPCLAHILPQASPVRAFQSNHAFENAPCVYKAILLPGTRLEVCCAPQYYLHNAAIKVKMRV